MTILRTADDRAVLDAAAPGFRPALWHTLAAALLLTVAACTGCHNENGPAPAPSVQSAPPAVASTSALDTLPAPVRDALSKDRPGAKVVKVKRRLYPDGMVHYLLNLTDAKGASHQDEYRSDGLKISAK